jgi:CheY-like chemotaxis protein
MPEVRDTWTWPARTMAHELRTPDRRRGCRPQRVLVVDDNEDLRQLWRTFLTLSGFLVTEAVDGADAVAKAVENTPVVILMDFSMPRMNGADAVRALKGHASTSATPVIGLTAQATSATEQSFHRICQTVLEKPASPEAVLEAMRGVLRPFPASPTRSRRRVPRR